MIPGEILPQDGDIELNAGRATVTLKVANTGDRPIQVGSHYHFAETNAAAACEARVREPFQHPEVIILQERPDLPIDLLL